MLPPRNTLRIRCFKGLKALGVDYCRSGVPARCVDVANVHLCWPMLVWACHDWISMDLGPHEDWFWPVSGYQWSIDLSQWWDFLRQRLLQFLKVVSPALRSASIPTLNTRMLQFLFAFSQLSHWWNVARASTPTSRRNYVQSHFMAGLCFTWRWADPFEPWSSCDKTLASYFQRIHFWTAHHDIDNIEGVVPNTFSIVGDRLDFLTPVSIGRALKTSRHLSFRGWLPWECARRSTCVALYGPHFPAGRVGCSREKEIDQWQENKFHGRKHFTWGMAQQLPSRPSPKLSHTFEQGPSPSFEPGSHSANGS